MSLLTRVFAGLTLAALTALPLSQTTDAGAGDGQPTASGSSEPADQVSGPDEPWEPLTALTNQLLSDLDATSDVVSTSRAALYTPDAQGVSRTLPTDPLDPIRIDLLRDQANRVNDSTNPDAALTAPAELEPATTAIDGEVSFQLLAPAGELIRAESRHPRIHRFSSTERAYDYELWPLNATGVRALFWLHGADAPHTFTFEVDLPDTVELLNMDLGGTALLRAGQSDLEPPLGHFLPPFAYDADGMPLKVSQQVTRESITLSVDPAGARYPVVIDPTYYSINCNYGTSQLFSVANYMRINGVCPYGMTFIWANGYWPSGGVVQGGAHRNVRQNGDCSPAGNPDTLWYYDFEIPCDMHDYCFDLLRVKAPFDYRTTVTYANCNNEFNAAMEEHCNSRWPSPNYALCHNEADVWSAMLDGCVWCPPGQDRPSGAWPSTEFLTNRGFSSSVTNWNLLPAAGGTANWAVYSSFGHDAPPRLEFNCNASLVGCSVFQERSIGNVGGERFQHSVWAYCPTSGGCPMSMAAWGWNGSTWTLLGSATATIPNSGSWHGAWHSMTVGAYQKVRVQVYNNSATANLDLDDFQFFIRSGF